MIDDVAIQQHLNIKPGCRLQGDCHFRNIE
jgi:hypothetical protein